MVAYFPFSWSPPRTVDNQVVRGADGSLSFGTMNAARTPGTPSWAAQVRATSTVRIRLEVDPASDRGRGSMMMLAGDYSHGDFSIQQYDSYVLVWLNRPGADLTGAPPFAVPDALQAGRWTTVQVAVDRGELTVDVDGVRRMTDHLPVDALRGWGQGRIALGDEVHGGGPWEGRIRSARVSTAGGDIDYVTPGALSIPPRYLYLPDHIEPFPPVSPDQWLRTILDMLSFLPVGFLLVRCRRPPLRPVTAVVCVAALAVVLAAGKIFFADRHTSLGVVLLQVTGGLLGALLAWWLARRRPSCGPPAAG